MEVYYSHRGVMIKNVLDLLGWGIILWLIGYILGIILFFILPVSLIGWFIMPIGLLVTTWVLQKKIKNRSLTYYLLLSLTWTTIAILLDYLFLVKLLKPEDGYYKTDVYLYYLFTFTLPLGIGWQKNK